MLTISEMQGFIAHWRYDAIRYCVFNMQSKMTDSQLSLLLYYMESNKKLNENKLKINNHTCITVRQWSMVQQWRNSQNFIISVKKNVCFSLYNTTLFLQKSNYCIIYKPSTDVGSPDVLVSFFSLLLIVKSRGELSIKVTHDVTG